MVFNLFRSSSSEHKVKQFQSSSPKAAVSRVPTTSTKASFHRISTVSTQHSVDIEHAVSSTEVRMRSFNTLSSALPTKLRLDVFPQNVNKPAVFIALPTFGDRIDNTPQLALCIGLLTRVDGATGQQEDPTQAFISDTGAQHAWVKAIKQDPTEQDRLRWLGARMVDEFAKDASKDSTEIKEMVLLGPVLENEHYRRLLSCTITAFEQAVLLDVVLLQGLVQLVQTAPSGSLLPDDLVRILRILRVRLQDTHQQSSIHPFYLTLAVSRLLDVMAEHKVQDLDRVEEHEPLSGVLSGLKGSSDPYLVYQACYAFQALQYVPNNENPLQTLLRHSTGVVDGLIKVTAALKLDLSTVLEGLGKLQDVLVSTVTIAGGVYEGAYSVLESGQGVFDSLKKGLGSGQKRPWYVAIRAAQAFVYAGQLKDLNVLICQSPCRRDPLFKWGICQLLGEIASDAVWNITIRKQAIDLLGDLYMIDSEWGQDESVKAFMLNILHQLSTISDQAVSSSAHTLLKNLGQGVETTTRLPYPLRNRLPLPTLSPILTRVLAIPDVEYDLHKHKVMILRQYQQTVFIPPLAKPGLKAKDNDLFPLLEKVLEFLVSERQVMLVLGDSGSGKSTFNRHLEHRLWTDYKQGGPIPLFINLPAIDRPDVDLIAKQLRINNFNDDQIQEMKQHRQIILICDGYDESQQLDNLHRSNRLNQPGQWNTKMVISCRTQFLGPAYVDQFKPQPTDHYDTSFQSLFQEAVIAPFSRDQIKNYVRQYARDSKTTHLFRKQSVWSAGKYMDALTAIPNIMDLVKNPFLLTLALKALPGLVASNKDLSSICITRVGLYDMFIDQWLEMNRLRIQPSKLSQRDLEAFASMHNDFIGYGVDYLLRLAAAIFKEQDGNPVVQYNHRLDRNSWKAEFFGNESDVRLLRDASPLTRTGNQYRFVHKSVLEYFLSRVIYNPVKTEEEELDSLIEAASSASLSLDANSPLFKKNLLAEPSIIQFLCDRVSMNPEFEQQLRSVIEQSKTDSRAAVAATNAITILVNSSVSFHSADLRGVKIPGADLSDGQFDSVQFQGADLSRVNLSRSWLRQVNVSGARMEGVQFGELQYLEMDNNVHACAYSLDGRMLAIEVRCLAYSSNRQWVASGHADGSLELWNLLTGEAGPVLQGHAYTVNGVAFSPNGQWIASSSADETLRLWDASTGALVTILSGHAASVRCVAFSPDGLQIASGGHNEVRLWETNFISSSCEVKYHVGPVWKATYSPDGRSIISLSGSYTIRKWDSLTGVSTWLPFDLPKSSSIQSIALSPKGSQVAVGHKDGSIRLWSLRTGAAGLILKGHMGSVISMAFSPCSRWIVSSDVNMAVWLWDFDSTKHRHVLSNMKAPVKLITVSPNGLQIAIGSADGTVHLFERHSGQAMSSIELEDGEIRALEYSPTSQQLAIGTQNNTVKLWSLRSEKPGVCLKGHKGRIKCVGYSPCGRWIASGSEDKSVRLWHRQESNETETWSCVSTVHGFFDTIVDVSWNPVVPMEFVTASWDGSIRVWRVSSDGKGGSVVVRLLWGPNFRILCAADMILEGVIGLSTTNKKLLTQRGAIESPSTFTRMESEE
ncbi:hypothetical protein BG015_010415 [Linnemannia schmuckeri]|uniref:WD40 repeat-like protein n=1 Tax=Linnemannia schmuckeri TaxID=64567 RepID=A0A9P5RUI2_9FUNG|nr:hypothetical protein BG015_010415 [Linnemannia schmuckeri]